MDMFRSIRFYLFTVLVITSCSSLAQEKITGLLLRYPNGEYEIVEKIEDTVDAWLPKLEIYRDVTGVREIHSISYDGFIHSKTWISEGRISNFEFYERVNPGEPTMTVNYFYSDGIIRRNLTGKSKVMTYTSDERFSFEATRIAYSNDLTILTNDRKINSITEGKFDNDWRPLRFSSSITGSDDNQLNQNYFQTYSWNGNGELVSLTQSIDEQNLLSLSFEIQDGELLLYRKLYDGERLYSINNEAFKIASNGFFSNLDYRSAFIDSSDKDRVDILVDDSFHVHYSENSSSLSITLPDQHLLVDLDSQEIFAEDFHYKPYFFPYQFEYLIR